MKLPTKILILTLLAFAALACAAGCGEFDFVTVNDANRLTESDHRYVADLHEESNKLVVDLIDAANALMTDQHVAMSPEVAEALLLLNTQNVALVAEMKRLSSETTAALKQIADETKAEGVDLMGADGWGTLAVALSSLGGVGWLAKNSTKPSRAAGEVEKLKSDAVTLDKELAASKFESFKELAALKLALAGAAGAGSTIPSGSTTVADHIPANG